MSTNPRFGRVLSDGIKRAAANQSDSISAFENRLAETMGYSIHAIRRWRKGHIPGDEQLAQLARYLVQTGRLDRDWLDRLLIEAHYDPKEYLLNKILPSPETAKLASKPTNLSVFQPEGANQEDWGEAPDVTTFYGRQAELDKLSHWLITDRCRLVGVLGMGGIGKTALVTRLAQQLKTEFDCVLWRSLRNAPPLEDILSECLQFLSESRQRDLPERIDRQLSLLLEDLRQRRCLLILDNVETILQEGERAGHYRQGYEAYSQLIRQMGETTHSSCLVVTSREKLQEFTMLEGETGPVRSLQLAGLGPSEGRAILTDKGLFGPDEICNTLVNHYSGNPLALKLIAETIREVFDGDIADFLPAGSLVFDGIRDVLDQQFARLSSLEQEIMFWLAIEREAVSREALQTNLVDIVPNQKLIEALNSLRRRSLIEKSHTSFTLQNVVLEYTTDRLIDQVCQEITTQA